MTDDPQITDYAANGMQRYWTCEAHPWLLWSGLHIPADGPTCPPDCPGPGMPIGLSLRRLHELERRLERPVPAPPDPSAVLITGELQVQVVGDVLLPMEGGAPEYARALLWPAGLCVDDVGAVVQVEGGGYEGFYGDLLEPVPRFWRPRIEMQAHALHPAGTKECCADYQPARGVNYAG